MNEQMNLMEAMQIIANAGLSVVSSDGKVKVKPKRRVKSRRPKGSGSVYKLSGKRSKPYLASVTIGYRDEDGHQIKKTIGYYSTREEALNALEVYNMQRKGLINQSNVIPTMEELQKDKVKCPTVKEIWDIVTENELSHLTDGALLNYKVSFNHFKDLHNKKINKIKLADIQPYFDELMVKGTSYSKMNCMKLVLNHIYKYACKYDYIEKNYAQFINFKDTLKEKNIKIPFTNQQINELLKNDENPIIKSILVMIFTGIRPSELLLIKKENVHLEENYMVGGIKTKNGKNRIIPIHPMIKSYIAKFMETDSDYLFYNNKTYANYLLDFNKVKEEFGFSCTPHSGRHTFATLSKLSNMNEFARKKILGHSCKNLTDDVYTHAPIEFLVKEVSKIKF